MLPSCVSRFLSVSVCVCVCFLSCLSPSISLSVVPCFRLLLCICPCLSPSLFLSLCLSSSLSLCLSVCVLAKQMPSSFPRVWDVYVVSVHCAFVDFPVWLCAPCCSWLRLTALPWLRPHPLKLSLPVPAPVPAWVPASGQQPRHQLLLPLKAALV